ncbi:hypothetical protein WICPIJ_002004 [Wickerhamomyces pijperi]|uniref:Uncharacterized protein n=1 Tax=Wickerhamomyces pijperi TaxID=599730 RepID=A0A9P8QCI9_WICPI|nr:hypothetical protein WICPIJ_002004 [Wickerhamomyces pijperi]
MQQCGVILQESQHDSEINVGWDVLRILERNQPSHLDTLDVGLVVGPLDGDKHLSQGSLSSNIRQPFVTNGIGVLGDFGGDVVCGWHDGEQEQHVQGVVNVSESVQKGWVTLLDDVVELVLRSVGFQSLSIG